MLAAFLLAPSDMGRFTERYRVRSYEPAVPSELFAKVQPAIVKFALKKVRAELCLLFVLFLSYCYAPTIHYHRHHLPTPHAHSGVFVTKEDCMQAKL